ncbi:hypothetical protein AAMO2058_001631600 [Amorphochlora amoebiformis]
MPRRGRRSRKKQASLADINQSPDMIELAAIAKQRRISAQLRRASLSKAKDAEEEGVTEDMWPPEPYPSEENWWVKSQWVVRWFVASQAWFDNFILLCIVVNCIFIAFSNPRLPQEHWQNSIAVTTVTLSCYYDNAKPLLRTITLSCLYDNGKAMFLPRNEAVTKGTAKLRGFTKANSPSLAAELPLA